MKTLEELLKLGQAEDDLKVPSRSGRPAAPAAPGNTGVPQRGTPKPAPAGNRFTANNPVKEMQTAILEFANAASSSDVTNMKGNQTGKEQSGKEYLGGSDPFGSFLAQNYLNDSDPVGKQYVNVDVAGNNNRDKASIEDTGLRGIIDSIKRIGTPGAMGEKSVDGVWQTRTNNALKNIYALGYAMLHLANDMGLALPGLDDNKLSELKKLIPENYTNVSQNEMGARAKALTAQIKDLTLVFGSFKKFVIDNKQYRSYIDQKKSFVQYKKKQDTKNGRDVLDENDKKIMGPEGMKPIPDVKLSNVKDEKNNWVSLADLNNMNSFSRMMQRIGRDPKSPEQVKQTLTEVSAALSGQPTAPAIDPGY